jgi:dUTP pyrophosphatase
MKIRITRVDPSLPLPEYKTSGAVAFDMYTREDATIAPGAIALLPSNLIVKIPDGYFLMIAARSSTAKKGLTLANGVGTIDQDFNGFENEIRIAVHNFTDAPVSVARGDRLAQGLILPIIKAEWEEVSRESLPKESRGSFGSTG